MYTKHKCLWNMYLRADFLDHRAHAFLTVLDNSNLSSKSVLISTPTSSSRCMSVPTLPILPGVWFYQLHKWYLKMWLFSIALTTEEVEHFPTFIGHLELLFGKVSVQVIPQLSYRFSSFAEKNQSCSAFHMYVLKISLHSHWGFSL